MVVSLGDIVEPVHASLKPLGFAKHGKRSWYRNTSEIIQLVRLEKSSYGEQNRVEIWVNLRRINENPRPAVQECGIRCNFSRLIPDKEPLKRAFNQEHDALTPAQRSEVIARNLTEHCVPILRSLETETGLLKLLNAIDDRNTLLVLPSTLEKLGLGKTV